MATIGKSVGPTLATRAIGMGIGFMLNLYTARVLGADGYGIFSFAISILAVAAIFINLGTEQLTIRWVTPRTLESRSREASEIAQFFRSAVLLVAVSATICVIILSPVFFISGQFRVVTAFVVIASPIVALTMLNEAMIRALGRVISSTLASQIIRPAVVLALIFAMVFLKEDISTSEVLFGYGVGISLAFFISLFWAWKSLAERRNHDSLKSSGVSVVDVFHLTKGYLLVSILGIVLNKIDVIVLGTKVPAAEVGQYAAAYNFCFLVLVILQVVNLVIAPKLAAAYSELDRPEIERLLKLSRLMAGGLAAPIFLVLLGFPSIVLAMLGPEFIGATNVLRILVVGMFLNALFGSVGNFLLMSGHELIFAAILASAILLCLVLLFLITPAYGIEGAAIAVSLTMLFWNILASLFSQRFLNRLG